MCERYIDIMEKALGAYSEKRLSEIVIAPEAVDPDDIEMLTDMIVAAVNEALTAAEEDAVKNLSKYTSGLNIPGLF